MQCFARRRSHLQKQDTGGFLQNLETEEPDSSVSSQDLRCRHTNLDSSDFCASFDVTTLDKEHHRLSGLLPVAESVKAMYEHLRAKPRRQYFGTRIC